MGMAASQARLLCITARIHDLEYQAQAIQTAKLQLATQSDRAYNDYLEALDATTLTISTIDPKSGSRSVISATFNNLFSRTKLVSSDGSNYALRTNNGQLVVEEEIYEGYMNFTKKGLDDAYQFALYMMNGGNEQGIGELVPGDFDMETFRGEEAVYSSLDESVKSEKLTRLHKDLEDLTGGNDIYNSTYVEDEEKYNKTMKAYRNELYKTQGEKVYGCFDDVQEFDEAEFNYFINIYNQIKHCGGCISIKEFDGNDGDAANDTEWLQSMVQCGQLRLSVVETDSSNGEVDMDGTSPSSDTCLAYTETTSIDKTALAKAEAKYNHSLREIDKKDKQYDLSLSKLETERNALTKEYDSVTKVIEENIERTFGIFS